MTAQTAEKSLLTGRTRRSGRVAATCPLCGADAPLRLQVSDARVHRCDACSHCFSDPASLRCHEPYAAAYYDHAHPNWNANPDRALFDRVLQTATALSGGGRLLDVGCSRMAFLEHAHRHGYPYELHGVDLAHHTPPHPAIRYTSSPIETFSPALQFAVITSFMVIEHVHDPECFVQRLAALGKPGALIIINTINDGSVLYRTARALACLGLAGPANRLYSHHHLHHFTTRSLADLVTRAGLRIRQSFFQELPMNQIDHAPMSRLGRTITHLGIRGCFALGRLTGMTYSQTLIAQV
ncbi:MAG TPA: class I SAM-dependent methyltransferase [Planctomycetota bacterium]|nr:class I SAM-dependent methyltransferase [Planctomycetota bacterium]